MDSVGIEQQRAPSAPARRAKRGGGGDRGKPPTVVATGPEPRRLVIEVGLPSRSLCGNGDAHGTVRSAIVKAQRQSGALAAYEALARHPETLQRPYFPRGVRVGIRVTVRRAAFWSARKLDDPNLQHGLKATIDGFADAGVWFNDSQHFFDGPVKWEKARPGEHGVTVLLTEVRDA